MIGIGLHHSGSSNSNDFNYYEFFGRDNILGDLNERVADGVTPIQKHQR